MVELVRFNKAKQRLIRGVYNASLVGIYDFTVFKILVNVYRIAARPSSPKDKRIPFVLVAFETTVMPPMVHETDSLDSSAMAT